MYKIAFIGAGNMASAIANGIISSKLINAENIFLYDKNENQYSKFPSECKYAANITEICNESDYIFLSVKPQNIKDVLSEVKSTDTKDKVFVSICAGITIESIEQILGKRKIVRTMPNTPMLLGLGVTALCKNDLVSESEFEFVTSLFASSGDTIELKEDEINAITAVTSSSPAYVYTFIKGMLEGAKSLGLDYDNILDVICKTIIGSVHMVLTKEKSVDDLIRMVKSPNGTTERALNVFDENNFIKTIEDAMIACSNRAEELAKLN